jgi:excisionase family DNA binding protein
MTEPAMYRVADVARLFAVSKSAAYAMIRRGELPAVRFGGAVRVPRDVVEAMLCPGRTEAPTSISRAEAEAPPTGSSASSVAAVPLPSARERRIVELLRSSSHARS